MNNPLFLDSIDHAGHALYAGAIDLIADNFVILIPLYLAILCFLRFWTFGKKNPTNGLPLPPGPPRRFFIGNLLQFPKKLYWTKFAEWADKYGDIIYISAAGRDIVVLSSAVHAHALLVGRSAIYCDRPTIPMVGELVGLNQGITLSPSNDFHRKGRKLMASSMNATSVKRFADIQTAASARLVSKILARPEDFRKYTHDFSGSIMLQVSYGYEPLERHDPLVQIACRALDAISQAATPGKWLVDVFPKLKHIPTWFPGAGFKRQAAIWRSQLSAFYSAGFDWAVEQEKAGKGDHLSLVSTRLAQDPDMNAEERYLLRNAGASIYGGGIESVSSSLSTFLLLISRYPEIQRQAQEQIDFVLGDSALPTLADRSRLPLVDAILKECLRMIPPAPLSGARVSNKDDVYEGYRLPKGSVVYINLYRIFHNPKLYKHPEVFNPLRFIDNPESEPDPFKLVFGFGKRICPGQCLSENTLFVVLAMCLAVLEMKCPKEDEQEGLPECTTGAFTQAGEFRCQFRCRNSKRKELIDELLGKGESEVKRMNERKNESIIKDKHDVLK